MEKEQDIISIHLERDQVKYLNFIFDDYVKRVRHDLKKLESVEEVAEESKEMYNKLIELNKQSVEFIESLSKKISTFLLEGDVDKSKEEEEKPKKKKVDKKKKKK